MQPLRSTAFSLIETLLALVVLSVGLLAVIALLPAGIRFPDEATVREAQARIIRWSAGWLEAGADSAEVRYFDAQGWPLASEDEEPAWAAHFSQPVSEGKTRPDTVVEIRPVRPRGAQAVPGRVYHVQTPPP